MNKISKILIIFFFIIIVNSASAQSEIDVDSILLQAQNSFQNGEFEDTILYTNQILEQYPNNTTALLLKGITLSIMEDYENALVNYENLLKNEPENIIALNNKAHALENLEKYYDAVAIYEKILEIEPNNTKAKLQISSIINKIGFISTNNSKYDVSVQVQVRNQSDNLVCLIHSKTVDYLPFSITDRYFESIPNKEIITINGEKRELVQLTDVFNIGSIDPFQSALKLYSNNNDNLTIVFLAHTDGCVVTEGDKTIAFWQISRIL